MQPTKSTCLMLKFFGLQKDSILGLHGMVLVVGSAADVAWVASSHISRLVCRMLSLLSKQVDKGTCSMLGWVTSLWNFKQNHQNLKEGAGLIVPVMTCYPRTKGLCATPCFKTQGRRSVREWDRAIKCCLALLMGLLWIQSSFYFCTSEKLEQQHCGLSR